MTRNGRRVRRRSLEQLIYPQTPTWRRIRLLLPLALLSTAVTVGLVDDREDPDGESPLAQAPVPAEAIKDPASYSIPGRISLGVAKGSRDRVVAAASTNGIPSAALAAYQRAETVINNADEGCNITWQLIAAIGRVESDHGRYGGNVLTTNGVSRPGIYGIALDGTHHTAEISDTDAGLYDRDKVWDRAVGPMQFIPSTWSDVGVDADGDGKRNPQDLDDAALAAAVYLCSGDADLATDPGQRQAVHRYNHSQSYVDLVLAIMAAYLDGDYTSVPNYTTSAITFTPDREYTAPGGRKHDGGRKHPGGHDGHATGAGPTPEPDPEPTPEPDPQPTGNGGKDPVRTIQDAVENVQNGVKDAVGGTIDGLLGPLTQLQAQLQCTVKYPLNGAKKQECLASYGL